MGREDGQEELRPVEFEVVSSGPEAGVRYSSLKPISPWKVKLIFWGIVVGGIALGAFFIFFFLALFIYLFIPLVAMIVLWQLVRALFLKR